jgi:PKHD-type hydroxylase
MLLQIPSVLDAAELNRLRADLSGATFEDGAATAGLAAKSAKRNLQARPDNDVTRKCSRMVLEALNRNALFFSAALPQRVHGPIFNRYDAGMTYGDHSDNAMMGTASTVRTDIAATLFLTPPEDYDGGELTVNDSYGAHRVKLPAGSVIVYPAGSIHRVETVTRGSRLAAVMWIQSLVRDEAQRRLLFEIDISLGSLRRKDAAKAEADALTSVYHNLLRMWGET